MVKQLSGVDCCCSACVRLCNCRFNPDETHNFFIQQKNYMLAADLHAHFCSKNYNQLFNLLFFNWCAKIQDFYLTSIVPTFLTRFLRLLNQSFTPCNSSNHSPGTYLDNTSLLSFLDMSLHHISCKYKIYSSFCNRSI